MAIAKNAGQVSMCCMLTYKKVRITHLIKQGYEAWPVQERELVHGPYKREN